MTINKANLSAQCNKCIAFLASHPLYAHTCHDEVKQAHWAGAAPVMGHMMKPSWDKLLKAAAEAHHHHNSSKSLSKTVCFVVVQATMSTAATTPPLDDLT
jgi:hypothetical protein